MNLANDLDAMADVMDAEKTTEFELVRDMADYLPHQMRPDQPLQDVIDRIRVRGTVNESINRSINRSIISLLTHDKTHTLTPGNTQLE